MRNLVIHHTYEARWKDNDIEHIITQPVDFMFNYHTPNDFVLNDLFTNVATFSDEEQEQIDQIFEKQLSDFIKIIIGTKPLAGFPNLFSSDRYIKKDLLVLLECSHDDTLIQTIDRLRTMQPCTARSESSFRTKVTEHSQCVVAYNTDIMENLAFQNNMLKLYLSIALNHKIQKSHWLCKKETYAYISAVMLKLPVAAIEFAFLFLLLMTIVMYCLVPLFVAIALVSAEISIMNAVLIMASWVLVLELAKTFQIFESVLKAVEYPFVSAAYWIDYGIQSLFGVEFFAFELSELLAKDILADHNLTLATPAPGNGVDEDDIPMISEDDIVILPDTTSYSP